MDIKRMQLLLMERGIRVADDDEIFTLLAFNGILLEESEKKQAQIFAELAGRVEQAKTSLVAGIHTMIDMDKKLVQSKADLLSSVESTKEIHAAHIADRLEASMRQIEAVSAERQDAFIKGAVSTSQAVIADLVKSGEDVKQSVLKGVGDEAVRLVRDRVARERTTLSEASQSFADTGGKFAQLYIELESRVDAQINKFSKGLDQIIAEKTPSVFASFATTYFAVLVASGTIIFIMKHFFN